MNKKPGRVKIFALLLSVGLFVTSLALPAFTVNYQGSIEAKAAIDALLMGSVAWLGGGGAEWLVWLANPLYLLAIVLFIASVKMSQWVSLAATLIALSFSTWQNILAAENGNTATLVHLDAGYWCWLAALATLTVATFYFFRHQKSKGTTTNI